MKQKAKKEKKAFNYKKWTKTFLRLGVVLSLIMLLVGGWATERQEDFNEQIFWNPNRLINGLGVFALIIGWGFWEFYLLIKSEKQWLFIGSIVLILISTILINGIDGIVAGCVGIACITTTYFLNKKKVISVRKSDN